jgi:hypothetical protein
MKWADLYRSLENPHPESAEFADEELGEWMRGLPDGDTEELLNSSAGKGGSLGSR